MKNLDKLKTTTNSTYSTYNPPVKEIKEMKLKVIVLTV